VNESKATSTHVETLLLNVFKTEKSHDFPSR
jgi:hypothetical protein